VTILEAPYDGNSARAFVTSLMPLWHLARVQRWGGAIGPVTWARRWESKRHMTGLMQGPHNPGLGMWAAGDRFECVPPQYSQTTRKVVATCIRLTSGGENTPGSDWINDYGTSS